MTKLENARVLKYPELPIPIVGDPTSHMFGDL